MFQRDLKLAQFMFRQLFQMSSPDNSAKLSYFLKVFQSWYRMRSLLETSLIYMCIHMHFSPRWFTQLAVEYIQQTIIHKAVFLSQSFLTQDNLWDSMICSQQCLYSNEVILNFYYACALETQQLAIKILFTQQICCYLDSFRQFQISMDMAGSDSIKRNTKRKKHVEPNDI